MTARYPNAPDYGTGKITRNRYDPPAVDQRMKQRVESLSVLVNEVISPISFILPVRGYMAVSTMA